jgi:hypothetical protein
MILLQGTKKWKCLGLIICLAGAIFAGWGGVNYPHMEGIILLSAGGGIFFIGCILSVKMALKACSLRQEILNGFIYFENPEKGLEILKFALQEGADVNGSDKDGDCPLYLAYIANNKSAMKLLLKYGANPDINEVDGKSIKEEILSLCRPPEKPVAAVRYDVD